MSELFDFRKQFLNNLVSLLESDTRMVDESLTISIDAGWGYGKSFFLNNLAKRLEDDGHMVVRFNAWETDLSNDAFISFADSLFTQLSEYITDTSEFFEKADLAMIAFASLMLDKFVSGLPLVGTVKRIITGTKDRYKKLVEKEGSYFINEVKKSGLELVKDRVNDSFASFFSKRKKQYQDKRVVVLVDELDRCRPDYSVQVLERVKHLFKDNRLSFVFAINKGELGKSICQTYGSIDVSVYFEKFFTYSFSLPQIDVDCFLSEDISFAGKDCHKVYYDLLVQMIKDANPPISLRQVEKVFNYFEAVCGVVSDFDEFTTAPYLFPVAIFSKVLDDDFFHTTFEKRNLKSYYSINGKNTAYSSIYNKIQSYDTHYKPDSYSSSKVGCDSLFKLMHSSHGSEIELPAWYSTNNKKLPICNNGSRIVIIKNNSQDFLRIYNVVDCLS